LIIEFNKIKHSQWNFDYAHENQGGEILITSNEILYSLKRLKKLGKWRCSGLNSFKILYISAKSFSNADNKFKKNDIIQVDHHI